jgi:hypothetical protein
MTLPNVMGERHKAQGARQRKFKNREVHQKWPAQNGIIGPTTTCLLAVILNSDYLP